MPMPKKIQAKHIDEAAILAWLRRRPGEWHTHMDPPEDIPSSGKINPWYLRYAFPGAGADIPGKVLLAKLRSMSKRALIDGCDCGCRGDWHVPTNPQVEHLIDTARVQHRLEYADMELVEYLDDEVLRVHLIGERKGVRYVITATGRSWKLLTSSETPEGSGGHLDSHTTENL